jgi:serine protease Do
MSFKGEKMIKKILTISALFLTLVTSAYSKELPDFTELAEKQGPSVVNISVTQVMQQNESPFSGMPDDEAFGELFRRFGLPMPGIPRGQMPPQEFKSQSLGSVLMAIF